jgi:hypothetical protein
VAGAGASLDAGGDKDEVGREADEESEQHAPRHEHLRREQPADVEQRALPK